MTIWVIIAVAIFLAAVLFDVDINAGPAKRFESDGIITITDSGSPFDVKLVEPGTVEVTVPYRQGIPYTDRGTQQDALEGDDNLGRVAFTVKAAAHEATGLMTRFTANTTTGLKKQFSTIVIKIPTGRGAATGQSLTLSSVWCAEQPVRSMGADFDTIRFVGEFKTYAEASY